MADLSEILASIDFRSETIDAMIANDLKLKAAAQRAALIANYLRDLSNWWDNNTIRDTRLTPLPRPIPPAGFTAPPDPKPKDDNAALTPPPGTIKFGSRNQYGEYQSEGSNVQLGTIATSPDGVRCVLIAITGFGGHRTKVWTPLAAE